MNEEEKISKLLGEMNKVSAPKSFQYQVNARIAKGRPVTGVRGYFTFLKYAVPAAVMVLVVGIVAIQTNFMYDINAVPAVAIDSGKQSIIGQEPISDLDKQSTTLVDETTKPVVETASETTQPEVKTPIFKASRKVTPRSVDGGSYDATLSAPRTTILPPGIRNAPQQPTPILNVPLEREPIEVSDVLDQLGIDVKQEGGDWIATDVRNGSLAERSGVKKADVIQAIDERQLKNLNEFSGGFSGKQITVVRDGKVIVLDLQ